MSSDEKGCVRSVRVGASSQQCDRLLTPEGEREWVPGWNPSYPAGEPSETSGTVFITDVHGVATIWMIHEIDRRGYTATYYRFTPGQHAGTVQVKCDDISDGRCVVTVNYDISLLPEGDPAELDEYDDAHFEAMLNHWAEAISRGSTSPS